MSYDKEKPLNGTKLSLARLIFSAFEKKIIEWYCLQFHGHFLELLLFFKENCFNPLNAKLNPICYLLALLGAYHFLHVSRIRVKNLSG